jgi:uncharacterized protein
MSEDPAEVGVSRGDLARMVRALLRPDAFCHVAHDLTLYETHISWVILAGAYAYKLKKPVNLGFLDFSTPERRRADCVDEVRLNRRLAPDVYLGIVEVVERDGRYFVGGPGTPVEPAVWMRRLPDDGMLPNLLMRGAVDVALVRRIAHRLARFHATAATGPGVDGYGAPDAVRAIWEENFAQMAPFVGRTVTAPIQETIREYIERFLRDSAALLERRVTTGRIRDGHGDLHAASVCVEGRRIHLFDCLEFAPRLRCADVAAEVAFLAMDLDHRGRADLADAFVASYARASGDSELGDLLDFYRCARAYVRGKVQSLRLGQPDLPADEIARVTDEARVYFELAWAYAGGLTRPALIVTMGPPASGKTTVARALAGRLGLLHLSSDVTRKELAGLRPSEHRPDAFGAGLYRPEMTQRTYATLRRRAALALCRGRSVVLDATYGRADEREALRRLAHRLGVPLVALVCKVDDSTLQARLAARTDETAGASDARLTLWPALRAAFVAPVEMPEAIAIDATARAATVEQAMAILTARLGSGEGPVRP